MTALKIEYSVEKPLNREPPIKTLISSFLTSEDGAYDRNHGPIPFINGDEHRVRVEGAVRKVLDLSISQLRNLFPQHEVTCVLQCAGNRRNTMRTVTKEVWGLDWNDGAVMNCCWSGPRLRDVLKLAEITLLDSEEGHVAFASFQTACQDDTYYGSSIPLERAMREDGDVILALQMNGKALPVKHGFPVRVIVPGVAGARAVKWLDQITVQLEESTNYYQQRDYKILPPEATDRKVAQKYWALTPALQDMPINSIIAFPLSGEAIKPSPAGTIQVQGYALPQADQGPVIKVEISSDNGGTWLEADISVGTHIPSKWCWVLWRAQLRVGKGKIQRIWSRATDKNGNTQPAQPPWNLRGVAYNGYGESRNILII